MDVSWNSAAFTELLNGPILNNLVQRAIRVEAAAKQNATGRPGPKVKTGRLRGSITWKPYPTSDSGVAGVHGPYVDIGSNVVYAPYVEKGHANKKHFFKAPNNYDGPTVTAKDGTTKLGWVVVAYTKPYPFLVPALEAARST